MLEVGKEEEQEGNNLVLFFLTCLRLNPKALCMLLANALPHAML